jgi:hypothetical protein
MILALPIACNILTRNIAPLASLSDTKSHIPPTPPGESSSLIHLLISLSLVTPEFRKSHPSSPSQYSPPRVDDKPQSSHATTAAISSSVDPPSNSLLLSLKEQVQPLLSALSFLPHLLSSH